ncbi:MAG: class I SAM-dependent methyltransferase [Burkholderiaceae bacterium]|nr:class I SAM-dependent methyltransferase [Burkholderiaceae bacterium]
MTPPTASHFTDPQAVARYAEGPRRNVPGYDSLLPMVRILLAERVPANGRVLVVGAGGGLELEDMAQAHPGWRFDGVDPSQPMLDLAVQRLQSAGVSNDRVALHHGYVQSAPAGPFDGATCLLTFHFVPREERVPMAAEIRRRLKPGAPFVAVHLSVADGAAGGDGGDGGDGGAGERDLWLSRYSAFQVASGMAPEMADRGWAKVAAELAVLTPQEDEAILREAGFSDVRMFYMGFAFRGWVGLA